MSLLIAFLLALLQPPISLDSAGVAFDAPSSGRYCLTVYQPDWFGDHRQTCATVAAGPARIDMPIGAGDHAFLSRLSPFVEWGPFQVPQSHAVWLPLVQRNPNSISSRLSLCQPSRNASGRSEFCTRHSAYDR